MTYYQELWRRCRNLGKTETIGRTVLGYEIPLIRGGSETLVVCSTHAREHCATEALFRTFEKNGLRCDFLPVHNVDGVLLAKFGADAVDVSRRKRLIEINGGEDFSLWKANANAVDLNVNFDARWSQGVRNVFFSAPENYVGPYPESEPETKAVASLLRREKYAQVVSFHAKGEVVYWGFAPNFLHYREAKAFADAMGYGIATAIGSCGGLKDYFDLLGNGLGLTVELGEDKFSHPYPDGEIPRLVEKLNQSMEILYENGKELKRKIYG